MDTQVATTRSGTLALATAGRSDAKGAWLTPAEERIVQEMAEGRRADWVSGRLAAKRAVVAVLASSGVAVPLGAVEIRARRNGSPRALVVPGAIPAGRLIANARGDRRFPAPAPALALSLAHRDGRALAAAALGARVGVDLERSWAVHPAALRYFGPPEERIAFSRGAADPTGLWALREAAWKALECAPSLPFHALRLRMDPAGHPVGVGRAASEPFGLTGYLPAAGRLWKPWPGYLAAVLVVSSEEPVGALPREAS